MTDSQIRLVARSRASMAEGIPVATVDTTYAWVRHVLSTLLETSVPDVLSDVVDNLPITIAASITVVERLTADQWVLLRHLGYLTQVTDPMNRIVVMTFDLRLSNKLGRSGDPDWASRGLQAWWISDESCGGKKPEFLHQVDKLTYTLSSITLTNGQRGDLLTLRTLGWMHSGTEFTDEGGAVLTYTRRKTLNSSLKGVLSRYACEGSPVQYLHFLGDDRIRVSSLTRDRPEVYVTSHTNPEYMVASKHVRGVFS